MFCLCGTPYLPIKSIPIDIDFKFDIKFIIEMAIE